MIQFVCRKYSLISLTLIFVSAVFVAVGAITAHHLYYYPALLFMIVSNILIMFGASLEFRSKKGFVLSFFNILFCFVFFIQFLVEQFPVLSSTDWHLGAVIVLFYAIDLLLFLHFLKGKISLNKQQTAVIAIHAATPMISAVLYYCGVPALIGLSIMVVIYAASFIYLNCLSHNFKKGYIYN